jgi:hypothetical protein
VVDTSTDDGVVFMVFAGVADLPHRDDLCRLLEAVHQTARSRGAQEVVADLSGLEFMNASCFRALVGWVNLVQELLDDNPYRIRFRYSSGHPWQQRSIHALKCFATELISLERVPEAAK